jgi:IPT/TIG domain
MSFTPQPDVFHPTLTAGEVMTDETWYYIDKVLETSASDTQFADKAKKAVRYILSSSGIDAMPTLTSISPDTGAALAEVTITATGTNFTAGSKVLVSGVEWPTSFVSSTSVTALVTLGNAGTLPVAVQAANGMLTTSVPFTVT